MTWPNQRLKLTRAALSVSRGMKVWQAARQLSLRFARTKVTRRSRILTVSSEHHKTTDFVRDTQSFCEARFLCREPRPFFGIALDQAMAALMS